MPLPCASLCLSLARYYYSVVPCSPHCDGGLPCHPCTTGLRAPEAGGKRFGLDAIVPPEDPNDGSAEATQTHMYETCAQPAVEDVLKGTLKSILSCYVHLSVHGCMGQQSNTAAVLVHRRPNGAAPSDATKFRHIS